MNYSSALEGSTVITTTVTVTVTLSHIDISHSWVLMNTIVKKKQDEC